MSVCLRLRVCNPTRKVITADRSIRIGGWMPTDGVHSAGSAEQSMLFAVAFGCSFEAGIYWHGEPHPTAGASVPHLRTCVLVSLSLPLAGDR